MKRASFISGLGHNLPDKVMKNEELSNYMDTSDEWITERSGIKERRVVERAKHSGIGPAELSIPAVEDALKMAKLNKEDIDLIIFSTAMPDYFLPGSGCLLQQKMGFPLIGALDIRVQCAGFIYGLSVADQFVKSGTYDNVLLVCSEVQSTTIDYSNRGRDVAVLFGDGAGAVIVSPTSESEGILSHHLHSEGKYAKELWIETPSAQMYPRLTNELVEEGRHHLKMNGREVFKQAVKRFPEVILECLEHNNLEPSDIDLFLPHQANIRINNMVQKKLGLSDSQVFNNIHKYGNTTSATIPILLSEAHQNGRIKDGDLILMAAFGSGFTWGASLIRW
tara:strand:- start:1868 stop:2875 length:1008 start_codon:yes stop_codon:yes gene_type:complete